MFYNHRSKYFCHIKPYFILIISNTLLFYSIHFYCLLFYIFKVKTLILCSIFKICVVPTKTFKKREINSDNKRINFLNNRI